MNYDLNDGDRQTYLSYTSKVLPRHTSYPTAPVWTDQWGAKEHIELLQEIGAKSAPISLYFHIPYCQKLCFYCACNKEVHPRETPAAESMIQSFITTLKREMTLVAEQIGSSPVNQVHFGGGTPTYLPESVLSELIAFMKSLFQVSEAAEVAIEVDPRTISGSYLELLKSLGFNRLSLGVQEFDHKIQEAVNRVQPVEMVEKVVVKARELGFESVNFDLIYGLPNQTVSSLENTLAEVIRLSPDRIAFYRLAVIPEIFKWQKAFTRKDMPSAPETLELNQFAIKYLTSHGYDFIGLDHFARHEEGLHKAFREGKLRRTFQGMTTGGTIDVIGLGPSAISIMDSGFSQNEKNIGKWHQMVAAGLPVVKGHLLNSDDRLRRELLQELYGYGRISKESLEKSYQIVFDDYFASELSRLDILVGEGIVVVDKEVIEVTRPLGHLLLRVVAAVFDNYLDNNAFRDGMQATGKNTGRSAIGSSI